MFQYVQNVRYMKDIKRTKIQLLEAKIIMCEVKNTTDRGFPDGAVARLQHCHHHGLGSNPTQGMNKRKKKRKIQWMALMRDWTLQKKRQVNGHVNVLFITLDIIVKMLLF